ncbi:UNVERIFIED_CONTAM: hypothetical protein FKN15_010663 [Acipenser sinensis]
MDCDRALRILKIEKLPPVVQLIKSSWLSLCIAEKKLVNTAGYSIFIPDRYLNSDLKGVDDESEHRDAPDLRTKQVLSVEKRDDTVTGDNAVLFQESVNKSVFKSQTSEGDGSGGEDGGVTQGDLEALLAGCYPKAGDSSTTAPPAGGKWVCAQSLEAKKENHNKHITDKLEVLAKAYTHQGDKWRALGYSKAINALQSYHKTVSSYEVREMALSLNPGLVAMACGSYRRGKATCGDVDVLITHPDGKSHKGIFSKVVHGLHQSGFLTDDLVNHEDNGNQKKYLGVCRLPGPGRRHRRLDIIVVPYSEFACALMYFTGSAHFNRSMRALAKTKTMSLSEHSLNRDVLRKGSLKVTPGLPLPTPAEKDVFTHLGLPYREPQERDW